MPYVVPKSVPQPVFTLTVKINELLAENRRLRQALPDPEKLELLAVWVDAIDRDRGIPVHHDEVQRDLRRWAQAAREALSPPP
jgi:hypothetical protein